jgi:methylisocitrate lyase
LKGAGIAMALYPLSAFRAMNKAAENVYEVIRKEGTQKSILSEMQTREELYDRINYYEYEKSLDKFQAEKREE